MPGHIALAGVPAQLVDARIERRIASGGGVHGKRAGGHRCREDILRCKKAGERQRRGNLRPIQ